MKIDWNDNTDPLADPPLSRRERRNDKRARRADQGHSRSALESALKADPRVAMWLSDPLDHKSGETLLRLLSLPGLARMAVMPDVHPSADVCVGTVLGVSDIVFPRAIGGDIGCGMAALPVGSLTLDEPEREEILRHFTRCIHPIMRSGKGVDEPPSFSPPSPDDFRDSRLRAIAAGDGERQLGTLGGGNHFVELQHDGDELWLMVHSGSRFMGQAVAAHYAKRAKAEGVCAAMNGLRADSAAGADYLSDQDWCVEYARANRAALLASASRAMARVVGIRPRWEKLLDIPHNFVRVETHASSGVGGGGESLLVHRKGAAPAHAGQAGIIPGSAGAYSVHVEGRGDPASLCSSSHGAGRVYSRSDAKTLVTEADVREQLRGITYAKDRARNLRDEAPAVYRDLRTVLEAQRDLVRVTRTLKPLVSFKAVGR